MSEVRCYIPEVVGEPKMTSPDFDWLKAKYYHPETREVVEWYKLPVGALVCDPTIPGKPGVDGRKWICKTPGGPWMIDGPAKGGGGWSRTGEAPNLSVTPSIHITVERPLAVYTPGAKGTRTETCYHGFLTEGVLRSTADSPT